MQRWMRTAAAAAVVAGALGMSACVLRAPVPAPPASQAAEPVPSGEPTPSVDPGSTAGPTPTPTPIAPVTTAIVDGACTPALIQAVLADAGTDGHTEGFSRPELIDGFAPVCAGTQPLEGNDYSSTFSYAVLPIDDAAIAAVEERVLATGLQRGDPVLTYYVDAQQAAMAMLYPMLLWQDFEDQGPFDDAEAWMLLLWYEPR